MPAWISLFTQLATSANYVWHRIRLFVVHILQIWIYNAINRYKDNSFSTRLASCANYFWQKIWVSEQFQSFFKITFDIEFGFRGFLLWKHYYANRNLQRDKLVSWQVVQHTTNCDMYKWLSVWRKFEFRQKFQVFFVVNILTIWIFKP